MKVELNGNSVFGNIYYTVVRNVVIGLHWFHIITWYYNVIIALDIFNSKPVSQFEKNGFEV